jgi:hypothetical protein
MTLLRRRRIPSPTQSAAIGIHRHRHIPSRSVVAAVGAEEAVGEAGAVAAGALAVVQLAAELAGIIAPSPLLPPSDLITQFFQRWWPHLVWVRHSTLLRRRIQRRGSSPLHCRKTLLVRNHTIHSRRRGVGTTPGSVAGKRICVPILAPASVP